MKFLNITLVFFSLLILVPNEVCSETYAVLFTGLKFWIISYAYEGAVARFYDTIYKHGIPKKNILTFSPNHIAYNVQNPFAGVIMHGTDEDYVEGKTPNYNEHLQVDYDGSILSLESFYEILVGNKTTVKDVGGTGRILEWGPKDTVIVYYVGYSVYGMLHLLNTRHLFFPREFVSLFEKLQECKPFGKMKLIIDTSYPGAMFDDSLETNGNILGYTLGARYTASQMCTMNKALNAITGICSSVAFFESFEKFRNLSHSEDRPAIDLFMEHRKFLADVEYEDGPNLYGRLELAAQPVSAYYGKKGKKSTEKSTKKNKQSESNIKAMIADAIKNDKTVRNFIWDKFISSDAEKNRLTNMISTIAVKAIEGTAVDENDLNETVTHISPPKLMTFEKVMRMVQSKCFSQMNLLLFTSLPFEKLIRVVDLDVSIDKITEAAESVCQ